MTASRLGCAPVVPDPLYKVPLELYPLGLLFAWFSAWIWFHLLPVRVGGRTLASWEILVLAFGTGLAAIVTTAPCQPNHAVMAGLTAPPVIIETVMAASSRLGKWLKRGTG